MTAFLPDWAQALLLIALTIVVLASLTRELPLQNVLLAGAIIGITSGVATSFGLLLSLPVEPRGYFAASGSRLFNVLAWPTPLVWVVIVLTARGVGKLILQPWRRSWNYGYRLLGITAGLSLALNLAIEFWSSERMGIFPDDAKSLIFRCVWWPAITLLTLIPATAALIRKKPGDPPPQRLPMIVWVSLNALFAISAIARQLWAVAGFNLAVAMAPVVFCWWCRRVGGPLQFDCRS